VAMACAFGGAVNQMVSDGGNLVMTGSEQEAIGIRVFDIISIPTSFGEDNPDVVTAFLQVTEDANAAYSVDRASMEATIAEAAGMEVGPSNALLDAFTFLDKATQLSDAWLGGTVQQVMKDQMDFFVEQEEIPTALDSYAPFVNTSFLEAVADAAWAAPAAEPETDSIVVANRLPNLSSNVVVEGTSRKGWFAEEGLTVQTVQTDDVRAALASGSAQIAAMEPGLLMQARDEGLDFVVVAGHRCGSLNTFAIQPDIPNAAALSGKDVLVGGVPGTPDADFRLALLKVNGWDLSTVDDINYVTVSGGSNAWTELFYEGKLAITPFFGRHKPGMVEYGANIAVNTIVELPDEFWVTTRDFLDNNPNAVARFVRQAVRMGQYWLDPANFPDILEVMDDYATDVEKEGDLSISQISFCPNSYVNEEYTQDLLEIAGISDIEPMSEWASLDDLLAAQAEFGMNNEGTPGAVHSPFKFEAPAAAPDVSGLDELDVAYFLEWPTAN